jgi:hypothetical protein
MAPSFTRNLRLAGPLALAFGVAVAFGACSSSSSTQAPNNGNRTDAPQVTASSAGGGSEATPAGNNGGDLAGSVNKLSDITSYRFTLVMKGGTYGAMLGPDPIKGTVVMKPTKAAYMSFMGIEMIEIDGKTYTKIGTSWDQSEDTSSTAMADSFAPDKLFGSYVGSAASGYKAVGEEQRNGMATIHYLADASVIDTYGSMLGVTGGTWSADAWVAKDGGYPVGVSIKSSGGSGDFEMTMDITNINDPANKVEAPI